jgi:regulator of RNase E activity RraA
MSNVGFRVFTMIERPPQEVVDGFRTLESTWVSDAMHRFGGMDGNILPADPAMRCVGPAITVRVAAGDNLMVYKALEIARPGDVLVIESRGFTSVAQWGDLTSMIGKGMGLAGAVMDGSLRDLAGIRAVGFPVFAKRWEVPNGALKDGPGEVNIPVAVGGVPVLPGDVVIADGNGVVIVPRADAADVLEKARQVMAYEAAKIKEFEAGKYLPSDLAEELARKGCDIIDQGDNS